MLFTNPWIELLVLVIIILYLFSARDDWKVRGAVAQGYTGERFNTASTWIALIVIVVMILLLGHWLWAVPDTLQERGRTVFHPLSEDAWTATLKVGKGKGLVDVGKEEKGRTSKDAQQRVEKGTKAKVDDFAFEPESVDYIIRRHDMPTKVIHFYSIESIVRGTAKWKESGVDKTDSLALPYSDRFTSKGVRNWIFERKFAEPLPGVDLPSGSSGGSGVIGTYQP
jgi:hypothetical protein